MNEFDVVRGIGADTPEPDAATTSAARARLLAAIRAEAATGGPAVRDTAVDLNARRKARTPRRPNRRRRLLAGAAIAATLATALAVPLVLHDPTPVTRDREGGTGVAGDVLATAEPAAVKVLTTAAVAAARTHEPPLGPGDYWYVRERGTKVGTNFDKAGSPKSFFYRTPYENETWWAIDGETRHRETLGRPQLLGPAERAAWVANGRPKLPGPEVRTNEEKLRDRSDGWLPMTYEQIVELPTDPVRLTDALSERLYAGQPMASCKEPADWDRRSPLGPCPHRPVTDVDRFGAIVFLVTHYPLPSGLRSALYQALTRLDGVELTGEVTDLAGRRGVGVTIGPPDEEELVPQRSVLIFDPATGRLLGSRSVLAAEVPGWRLTPGTVMEETAFLEMSVVDSPTTRPKTGR
jgi:hypothetical protein